jgi:hypothetical protein
MDKIELVVGEAGSRGAEGQGSRGAEGQGEYIFNGQLTTDN